MSESHPMHPPPVSVPSAVMFAYPWGLHAVGLETALEELRACGIEAVQLALTYHVGTFLNPRSTAGPVRHGDLGALHFDPARVTGVTWPFQPPVAHEARDNASFDAIVSAAVATGLQVYTWIVYLYNHSVARAHPDLAVRNAWGVPHAAHLCPTNPIVRSYALSLTRAGIEIAHPHGMHVESLSFLPFDHGWLNAKAAIDVGPRARSLLGLCFCDHCRAAADAVGIDAAALAGQCRSWLFEHLNRLPDGCDDDSVAGVDLDEALASDLAGFHAMRDRVVTSLQREVLELLYSHEIRRTSDFVERSDADTSAAALASVVDLVSERRVKVRPGVPAGDIVPRGEAAGFAERPARRAFLQLGHFVTQASFDEALDAAASAGLASYAFYEYSLLTRRHLEWLRDSSRFWS